MRRSTWILVLVLCSTALAPLARAQVIEEHLRRIEAQTPKDSLMNQWTAKEEGETTFQWGGWDALSVLFLDNADNSNATPDAVSRILIKDSRLWGKIDFNDNSSFYGRIKYINFDFELAPGAARPFLSNERLDVDLAYYDKPVADDTNIRVGRQYIRQGRGITLNGNYDGILANKDTGKWNYTAYLVKNPPNEPDIETQRNPNVAALFTEGNRYFSSLNVSYLNEESERYFAYYLGERDNSDQPAAVVPALQRFDYDADYYALGTAGDFTQQLSYYGEAIAERGSEIAVGTTGQRISIDGFASYGEFVYHPKWWGHPTFSAEYARGTGNPTQPAGINTANSQEVLGGRGVDSSFLGFGRFDFGIALNPRLSNMVIERAGATWKPFETTRYLETMTLGGKFSIYQKDDPAGGISNTQAILANDDVGTGIDIFLGWRPLSDLTIIAQYGHFSPGAAFAPGANDDASTTFVSATYSY